MSEAGEVVVDAAGAGVRLDAYLADQPGLGSRTAAQRAIEAGRVTVDGRIVAKRHSLTEGERIRIAPDTPQPRATQSKAAAAIDFEVAYEDEHLLVVDKPAGLVVHPAPGHREATLAEALSGYGVRGGEAWRPGIVHRLDKDTSGLLVVARSPEVHRALQDALRQREVRREYLALVDGRPGARSGTIDAPIGRDRRNRTVVSTSTDRARLARTHFEQEEALAGCTLLRVRLETGRTHQIRAHMLAIGHPVAGDRDYGGAALGKTLELDRQFLHSATLAFSHPVSRAEVCCTSELPPDLDRALAAARAGGAAPGARSPLSSEAE